MDVLYRTKLTLENLEEIINYLNRKYNVFKEVAIIGLCHLEDNIWYNMGINIFFLKQEGNSPPEFKEKNNFLNFIITYKIEDFFDIYKIFIKNKAFDINGYHIQCYREDKKEFQYIHSDIITSSEFMELYNTKISANSLTIGCNYYSSNQIKNNEEFEELGYDSVSEMLFFLVDNIFYKFSKREPRMDFSYVKIIIPNYHISIKDASITDNNVIVRINRANANIGLDGFKMIIRLLNETGMISTPIEFGKVETKKIIKVNQNINEAIVKLQYKDRNCPIPYLIDKISAVHGPSGGFIGNEFSSMDVDQKFLKESLRGKDSNRFEWAICTLFSLLHFNTIWSGFPPGGKLKKDIDILISVPNYLAIMMIECTVKDGDLNKKLQLLYPKINDIKSNYPKYHFLPCIAINKDLLDIPEQIRKDCMSDNILLITNELSEKLLSYVGTGKHSITIFMEMQKEINNQFVDDSPKLPYWH